MFGKQAQFSVGHDEFHRATIQANNKLREHPNGGLVDILQSGKTDAYLPNELVLLANRSARLVLDLAASTLPAMATITITVQQDVQVAFDIATCDENRSKNGSIKRRKLITTTKVVALASCLSVCFLS